MGVACSSKSATLVKSQSSVKTKNGTTVKRSSVISLDNTQKKQIRESWEMLRVDLAGIGLKVFKKIFELEPVTKQLFGVVDVPVEELGRSKKIRSHAIMFMKTVGNTVENIDEESILQEQLSDLGARHVSVVNGFDKRYFDVFVEAILTTFKEELGHIGMSESLSNAWVSLLCSMRNIMMEAYSKNIDK